MVSDAAAIDDIRTPGEAGSLYLFH